MILYLDASAIVKNYISEPGSKEVRHALKQAKRIGTHLVCRIEVVAAFAKAVRMNMLSRDKAFECLSNFRNDWPDLIRLQVTEVLVSHAESLAWNHGLRGYDAIHLAAAALWQELLGSSVTVATFDLDLWRAVRKEGLLPYPEDLKPTLSRRLP